MKPARKRARPRFPEPVPGVEFDTHHGKPVCASVWLRPGKLSHTVQPNRRVCAYVSIGLDGRPALIEFFQPVAASVAFEILNSAFEKQSPTDAEWRAAVGWCAQALRWWEDASVAA